MLDAAGKIVLFVGLAGLAFAPLERLHGHGHAGRRRGWLADLGFATLGEGIVAVGLITLVGSVLAWLDAAAPDEPLLSAIETRSLRITAEVAVGLLVFELMGYLYHRLAHAVPWLWRLHAVHHSSERMDWLASFRQHPLEILATTLVQNAPLVLLGIPLGSHALVLVLLKINTVFVHADLELREGWWSELVATPRFHHRHHQRDGRPRNFSAMFPWLDRLLGTYDAAPADRVGLVQPMPHGFAGLLAWPLRGRSRSAISGCQRRPTVGR